MRRLAALVAVVAALQGCGGGDVDNAPLAPADTAVAFQGDAAHSGVSGVLAPQFPASAAWMRTFADPVSYPLIAGGRVFVVERGGQGTGHASRLHALDRDSGAIAWAAIDVPGTFPAAGHAFDRGTVYVSTFEGLVLSFDAATGRPGWSTKLPASYGFVTAPTAIDGVVYVADGGTNRVVALDGATGALLWTTPVNGGGTSIPSVAYGVVVLANVCQYYGLDARTGAERWHHDGGCGGGGGATVPIAAGTAYIRDRDFTAAATPIIDRRDATSGADKGRRSGAGLTSQIPIPAATAGAVFLLEGATLRRYDSALAAAGWSFAGDGSLTTAPLVVDTTVVVAGTSGRLYAVDIGTGAQKWSAQLPSSLDDGNDTFGVAPLTGLAAAEGTLVVPARNSLTAFRLRP